MGKRGLLGIHMGALGLSYYHEQWDRWLKGTGLITLLDVQFRDTHHHNGWYPELKERFPEAYLCVRHYSETSWEDIHRGHKWSDFSHLPSDYDNPESGKLHIKLWAKEIVRRHAQFGGDILFDPNAIIVGWNEQDLAFEGHEQAATIENPNPDISFYHYLWDWQYALIEAIVNEVLWVYGKKPTCWFGIGKLAGGHEPKGYPPEWEYTLPGFKALTEIDKTLGVKPVILTHHYFYDTGEGTRWDNGGAWHSLRSIRPKGFREDVLGHMPINGRKDPGGVAVQYPRLPFGIIEFGNWLHSNPSPEAIALTLKGYNDVFKAYADFGRCIGITPFVWCAGDEHKENRFISDKNVVNWGLIDGLADMQPYEAAELKIQEEEPVSKFEFKLGFLEFSKQYPVGEPTSDLMYDGFGNAFQYTTTGKLEWNKVSNQILFFTGKVKS